MISKIYMSGVAAALRDVGICQFDNFAGAIEKAAADLSTAIGAQPPSQDQSQPQMSEPAQAGPQENPGVGVGESADPGEVAYVGQSGLTDKDIESAAKVVQVLAEMKQQSDATALGMQQAQPGVATPGQPPLPPAPQSPQSKTPPSTMGQ